MIKAILLLVSTGVLVYLIFRISKRGISKKYDRKPESAWSALNDGIDPTI
jgi:phosphatidylglycerophosphatase A